jgi:hypothetical protein
VCNARIKSYIVNLHLCQVYKGAAKNGHKILSADVASLLQKNEKKFRTPEFTR